MMKGIFCRVADEWDDSHFFLVKGFWKHQKACY